MVRRICRLIKMVMNVLLCVSGTINLEFLGHIPPFFFTSKIPVFRYLLALQDSAKYSLVNTSTLGKLSEKSVLRVQNEQFSEEKDSFYAILKRKYSFRRDSNPRSMGCEANDLPLSYLTC